jgi:HKD family nuclease
MAKLTFINPLDQPTGRRRLLGDLKLSIEEANFSDFRMIIAYAKVGPLLRLQSMIEARKASGLRLEAIFGVDQQGTSAQALAFALEHFDHVYITREPNMTFHPKIYSFQGTAHARVFVGSNNLTVGGTETNFEAAIRIDLSLPDDEDALKQFNEAWAEMLPSACPATKKLNQTLLVELMRDGTVPDETAMRAGRGSGIGGHASPPRAPRSGLKVKPPSALPARKVAKKVAPVTAPTITAPSTANVDPNTAQGIVIQIKPHHNGEIFLSVTAALQNPAFFKWPFNGMTVPKRGGNAGYPQLTPDPRVNAVVYGAPADPLLVLQNYLLNTVYYEKNSEIRITASPLVSLVPEYSVMIMRRSDEPGIDYEMIIHTPDSPEYEDWVAACNQQMPSGGKKPRRFGWF